MIEAITEDNKLIKMFCMKDWVYAMHIMVSWVILDAL